MVDTTLSMSIDAKGVKSGSDTAVRSLDDIRKSAKQSAAAVEKYQKSLDLAGNAASSLKSTLTGLATAYGIKEVVEVADKYALLNARIRLVNESQINAIQVYDRLKISANDNLSSLEATATLYTRLSSATRQYGASQAQIIALTDAVNKTFRISGATAEEAANGAIQFGQALGSGKFAGDEFRSVSESNLRIMQALAAAFGVTTDELKKMASDGLLTTSAILEKFPGQFEAINKEAATLPVTVGSAFSVLGNNLMDYIGVTNEANGGTSSLADAVLGLAKNLDSMGKALIIITAASIPTAIYRVASSIAAMESATIAATAAMLLNPLFIIATGGAAAIGGLIAFRKEITNITDGFIQVGKIDASNSITVIGKALDESGKKIKEYGESLKKPYVLAGRENVKRKLDEEIENYDRLQKAYDIVYAKSIPLVESNKKIEESTVGVSKEIQTLIDKNKNVGDNFGKTSQQIALETIQAYKLGDEYKKLTMSKASADIQSVKGIELAETQLKSAIAQEASQKALIKTEKELSEAQQKRNDIIQKRNELMEVSKLDAEQSLRLNVANQISEEQYKKVQNAIEIENKLREVGLTIKDEEGKKIAAIIRMQQLNTAGIEAGTKAREDANKAMEEANKAAEDALRLQEELNEKRAQPFIDAAKNIQSGVAKSIEDAAKEGLRDGFSGNTVKNTFKSFGDLLKDTIITSIANGLAASLTTGLISPFLGNLATAMNGQAVGGAVNKGLGVGGLSSIGGLASGLFGAGGLAASGGFGAINMFGASTLGTGLPALAGSGVIGSGLLGGATLTGLLGAGAIGLGAGSLTARLTGGNAIGGAIGGAAGGLAGGLAGQALIPIPGVGFVIGSALGGIAGGGLGGLFGAGKGVSAAEFAGNITSAGLSGVSADAKNGNKSQAQGLADSLGSFLSQIVASGINIAATDIRGAINSKSGNRFEVLGQRIGFDPLDAQSVTNAISKVSIELIKAGDNSGSLAVALQNIQTDGRKAEEILADLNFAANFDKLGDAPKKLTAVEQAVDALNAQFDAAEETAKRLGLSEEKLAGYRKQQFDLLTTQFNDDISAQILAITDPTTAAINELNKAFVDVRINATAVGGDMAKVEELYNLKLIEINKSANDNILQEKQQAAKDYLATEIDLQNDIAKNLETTKSKFEGFASSLRSFRLGLLTNPSLSPLSNEERFRAAQAQFNSVSSLAKLGNEDAINQLQDTSQSYLEAAKEYYGTTAPVFDAVQSALENTESLAVRQANIAGQQLNAANTQIAILTSIRDNLSKSQATGAASNPTKYGTDPKISQINYLLDAATNFKFKGNFGGGAFDRFAASSAISDAEREAARNVHRSFGLIPAYANGGEHPGGLRIVGERGAELEATGSSKIITNKTLMEALSGGNNAEIIAAMKSSDQANREELRALRRQLAESDKRNQELIMQLKNNQEKTNSQLISIMTRSNVRAV